MHRALRPVKLALEVVDLQQHQQELVGPGIQARTQGGDLGFELLDPAGLCHLPSSLRRSNSISMSM